mmetsp:Transcript_16821/g.36182  ORF Transcript_16821/g.36182 Transcript_16821/m.36182 type:complete len:687 (+) Transcript_16821:102-2162(+)
MANNGSGGVAFTRLASDSPPASRAATFSQGPVVSSSSVAAPSNDVAACHDGPVEPKEANSAGAAVHPAKDVQADKPQEEKVCIVCLTEEVEIMLLPCRHAVLCRECAATVREGRLGADGKCPICRIPIKGVVLGHFLEDYVRMLTKAENNLDWFQANMYDGMYNNVRILMSTGALAAGGAVVCFFLIPPPFAFGAGIACAAGAFLFGYVPWFLTTAQAFEKEDKAVRVHTPMTLFSREDLSRPLTLMTKAAVVAIGFPVAVVVFFAPYAAYRFLIRPALGATMTGGVRSSCWLTAYCILPAGRLIAKAARLTAGGLYWTGERCWWGLCAFGRSCYWVGERCWWGLCAAGRTTLRAASAVWEMLTRAANCVYEYVLTPIGHGMSRVGSFVYNCAAWVANCIYDWILTPIGQGISWTGRAILDYILKPTGQAICWGCSKLWQGIKWIGEEIVAPCLRHTFRGIGWVVGKICYGCVWVLSRGIYGICYGLYHLYTDVLVPLGSCISEGCSKVYALVVLPLGRMLAYGCRAVGSGLYYVGSAVGGGLYFVGSSVASGVGFVARSLVAGAAWISRNIVVPVAEKTYAYVIKPVGAVISWIGSGLWAAGRLAWGAAAAVASRVAAVAAVIGEACRSVLSAGFEACRSVASATSEVVRSVAAIVSDTIRAGITTVSEAFSSVLAATSRMARPA